MRVVVALLVSLFFIGCEKDNDKNCKEAKSSFFWQKDRSLEEINTLIEGDTVSFITVHGGKDLLFTFQYESEYCTDRQDDGFTRYLRFLVPENAKSFRYTDAGLADASTNYTISGWWVNAGAHPVSKGSVSGKLINATQWKVELDLYLGDSTAAEHVMMERIFNLK